MRDALSGEFFGSALLLRPRAENKKTDSHPES